MAGGMTCNCEGGGRRAAKYRRNRVSIKEQVKSRDASGLPVETPTTLSNGAGVPCAIYDVRGQERPRGVAIEAGIDFVVEIRYRNDLQSTYELEVTKGPHLGKVLDVVAILYRPENGRPRETHLHCKHKAT